MNGGGLGREVGMGGVREEEGGREAGRGRQAERDRTAGMGEGGEGGRRG